jgi:hypothetical protein
MKVKTYSLKMACVEWATVFFHAIMWKKQAPRACFNLFLVLLLSLESVAVYVNLQLL